MNDTDKRAIEEIPADVVIQALKCCASSEYNCHHCPFKGVGIISDSCITAMSRAALDLIYRKQSEGEWLVKWRSTFPQYEPSEYECSNCGYRRTVLHKYCPKCGAKMKEV